MPGVTRIAVVSDTHNRVPVNFLSELSDADAIWHLGDVCNPDILEEFRNLGRPLRIVRGNCDSHFEWPLTEDFIEQGHRIRLIHIPPSRAPDSIDILLHGHTHVPRNERVGRTLFLNPGCVSRPNRGAPASFAWLTLAPGQPLHWEIVCL